jgi:hypothetical protein
VTLTPTLHPDLLRLLSDASDALLLAALGKGDPETEAKLAGKLERLIDRHGGRTWEASPNGEALGAGASVPAEGILIRCSECGAVTRVYHLDWTAMTCSNCEFMLALRDWTRA